MRIVKKWGSPIIVLFLLVGLLLSFRSFLMANIVEPIAMLGWVAWRFVISVDQYLYWMLLVITCSILIVRFAFLGKGPLPQSAYHDPDAVLSRLEVWRQLIEQAALGKKERAEFQVRITQLYLDSLGEQADLQQVAHPRLQDWFTLPAEERRAFSLLPGSEKFSLFPKRLRKRLNQIIPPDYTLIDEILTQVEKELEITYEE
jgi:hypothetical protein